MTAVRIRALVALIVMLAAFAGAKAWRPTKHLSDTLPKVELETMFPKAFGDWVVDERMPVQLISPDTQAAINKIYNQTLSRTYVNRVGERVMLSVAYGGDQSDALSAHRPEACYPAQGFEIAASSIGQLQTAVQPLRVRRLVARLGGRMEPITYWVVVGEKTAVTGTEQKLAQLKYSTVGTIPDGMLVRVSSIDPDADRAYELHRRFVDALASAVQPGVRARTFGAAAQ
ncbi:MAG: EpsI family protein [Ideonella sp.]|nr:EpsI family protein [Ideonella sp.]